LESLPEQSITSSQRWQELWQGYAREFAGLDRLEVSLGYTFTQRNLLFEALTHRSAVSGFKPRAPQSAGKKKTRAALPVLPWNERIEFLGDAVLDLVVSSFLWQRPEQLSEGTLSRIRANVVNEARLAEIARTLTVEEVLVVGKSVRNSSPQIPDALLADALEALVGAVFVDGGFTRAQEVVERLFAPYLQQSLAQLDRDYKTSLQEWAQEHFGEKPQYLVENEHGPDHAKEFSVAVFLQNKSFGHGKGVSKKQAEQAAAFTALEEIARGAFTKKRNKP
jgi:ribonuclease-3